jgi:hypothetical protein
MITQPTTRPPAAKRQAINSKGCISTNKAISPHKSQQGVTSAIKDYSALRHGSRVEQGQAGIQAGLSTLSHGTRGGKGRGMAICHIEPHPRTL